MLPRPNGLGYCLWIQRSGVRFLSGFLQFLLHFDVIITLLLFISLLITFVLYLFYYFILLFYFNFIFYLFFSHYVSIIYFIKHYLFPFLISLLILLILFLFSFIIFYFIRLFVDWVIYLLIFIYFYLLILFIFLWLWMMIIRLCKKIVVGVVGIIIYLLSTCYYKLILSRPYRPSFWSTQVLSTLDQLPSMLSWTGTPWLDYIYLCIGHSGGGRSPGASILPLFVPDAGGIGLPLWGSILEIGYLKQIMTIQLHEPPLHEWMFPHVPKR